MARSALRRLALVVFGIVVALVAIEATLQVGAWYLRWRGRPEPTAWGVGARRVVCLGDSNTYGLYLQRPQAYPAQVQQRWDARPSLPRVEILNLGVPGTNSSKLRKNFDRILHSLAPDVALIMIGANDSWTVPVPLGEGVTTPLQRLWSRSRVFRLLYMMRRAVVNRRLDVSVEFVPPGQPRPKGAVRVGDEEIDLAYTAQTPEWAEWPQALRDNLDAMLAMARADGVQPVLVTYPSEYLMYEAANAVMRSAARDSRTPLIDVAAAMRARCPQGGCAELFLPDHHATARGNEIVADAVVNGLAAVLDGRKGG